MERKISIHLRVLHLPLHARQIMSDIISSPQNPKIKNLKKLDKAAERKEQGAFVVEGLREAVLAARAGYVLQSVFICSARLKEQSDYPLQEVLSAVNAQQVFYVTEGVYETVAYRESTEGIIAVAEVKNLTPESLLLSENALVLVIEGVEKPGNLGAMLRTCDAAGVDAVLICDTRCDVYNPNVIRSGIGTLFTNQVAVCTTAQAIRFLKEKNFKAVAASPYAANYHYHESYVGPTAFVVGTESTGLSKEWMQAADVQVKIPMLGEIDSLNVSVSAALVLFEAVRQRHP